MLFYAILCDQKLRISYLSILIMPSGKVTLARTFFEPNKNQIRFFSGWKQKYYHRPIHSQNISRAIKSGSFIIFFLFLVFCILIDI